MPKRSSKEEEEENRNNKVEMAAFDISTLSWRGVRFAPYR